MAKVNEVEFEEVEKVREQVYYSNPCCCDCTLQEGVGWIAAFEFIWGLVNTIVGLAYIVLSKNAENRISSNSTDSDKGKDESWSKFGQEHYNGLLGVVSLHSVELVLALLLMTASARRIRHCCFAWIAGIILVFIAELACTVLDPFSLTFVLIGVNPFRIYFAFIVWSLAHEILTYPQGPPVNRVLTQPRPTTYIERPMYDYAPAPIIVPSYGYGGYYGGYPYGYGGDAALLGLGLGVGIGLGGGYGYGYGGYYDDCYF